MGVLGLIWSGVWWLLQKIAAGLYWFVKIRVTLLLESGSKVVFLCDRYETQKNGGTNRIVSINTFGSRGFPHYTDLGKIDAIYSRKVSRWHRLPKD